MTQVYKKALHGFFMKVHPDFFTRNPEWQRTNQKSIASLNELLDWAREFKAGANKAPPATNIQFTFYRRPDDDAAEPVVQSQFELPRGFVAGPTTVGVAERAVNKFLRDLLRRADCIDDVAAGLSSAQDSEQARQEMRRTHNPRRQPKAVRTLMDEAVDVASESAMPDNAPSIDDLIHSDQILFDRSLSPMQSAVALQTLSTGLPEMMYERWYMVPLVVGDEWGVGKSDIKSSISVPWSFTVQQFRSFIVAQADKVARCCDELQAHAATIEGYIADLCREADLDDVLITCSHAEATPCLNLLRENANLLVLHGVTGITVEIGYDLAVRDNGVLIFDCNMTSEVLQSKILRIAALMPDLRPRYARAKQLLASIEWHLKRASEAIRAAAIDPFTTDATYEHRLQFVKELHRISPQLAQWDWKEFTFVMSGGDVEIDWDAHVILVPHNFDGDNLVRYVTDIHSGAKQQELERLAEFESARKRDKEASAMAATALLESPGGARDGKITVDVDDVQPPVEAWRAEYLTSSDKGGEEFSVEAPLAHKTNFMSEFEADDQMLWEGSKRTPYNEMPVHREADDDDAWFMIASSNRKVREEAVKVALDKLKSRYGSKKDRGVKLGDVFGINNPREKPYAFPTVAKGTHMPPARE